MADCIFCRIVRGESPATILYQDEDVIAFRDISPSAPFHILIAPCRHIVNLAEIEADSAALMGKLITMAASLAKAEPLAAAGYRLVTNVGRAGGQSVWHMHWHLMAGRRMTWPPG